MDIAETVIGILVWHAGLEVNDVSLDTPMSELILDEIDRDEIVFEIEVEYNININEIWDSFNTIKDVVDFCEKNKQ